MLLLMLGQKEITVMYVKTFNAREAGKKFSRKHLEIFFLFCSENRHYTSLQIVSFGDSSCKLETICMKGQGLFAGKNKKNIISLLSADFVQTVVTFK